MKSILIILLLFTSPLVFGTHLKGGYIRIEKQAGLSYIIRIEVFTNTLNTSVLVGGEGEVLKFGDGAEMEIPEQINFEVKPGIFIATFEVLHHYSASGRYIISYGEPNRNEGLVNLDQSVNTPFYLESSFVADASLPMASPEFLTTPNFDAAIDSDYSFGITAIDPNGYFLTYAAVTPKNVINYRLPENFKVNRYSGLCTWDTKFQGVSNVGAYLFSIQVDQFNKGEHIGYVMLDFQVELHETDHTLLITQQTPLGGEHNDFLLAESETAEWIINFDEENGSIDSITVELYSEIEGDLDFRVYGTMVDGKKRSVAIVGFTHSPSLTRDEPYALTIRGNSFKSGERSLSADVTVLIRTSDAPLGGLVTEVTDYSGQRYSFLFPNPFTNHVRVSLGNEKTADLLVYSINKKILFNGLVTDGELVSLETSEDFLIYKIVTDQGNHQGKLVRK